MVRTRVGYTGGDSLDPTYSNLGGHSEAFQVDFDPDQISYTRLLDLFWCGHDPAWQSPARQYRAGVWFHHPEQEAVLLDTRAGLEKDLGRPVKTSISPAGPFYRAEDYHQKYYLRNRRVIFDEISARFPDFRSLVDSTLAARINGYLGGYGTEAQLAADMERLDLSEASRKRLLAVAKRLRDPLRIDGLMCRRAA